MFYSLVTASVLKSAPNFIISTILILKITDAALSSATSGDPLELQSNQPQSFKNSGNLVDATTYYTKMLTVGVEAGAPMAVLPCPVEVPRALVKHVDMAWILGSSGLVRRASDNDDRSKKQRYRVDPNNSTLFITVRKEKTYIFHEN